MNTMTITIMSLWDASTHEYAVITDETDPEVILEKVFVRQQDDTKDVPNIPSMCAGDIVSVNTTRFLCMTNGWKRLTLELFYQWTVSSQLERMFLARN